MLKGKKGSEMTIGTIVIIVLAIVVLVVLVLGFSTGWKDLWGRITSFFGSTNVDTIVQACGVACDTGSKNAYCSQQRTVRADNKEQFMVNKTGELVSDAEWKVIGDDTARTEKGYKKSNVCEASCKQLYDSRAEIGISNFPDCPALGCTTPAA